jgi:hypothetical protein
VPSSLSHLEVEPWKAGKEHRANDPVAGTMVSALDDD